MSVLKFDYKEASPDRQEEMLSDVISKYRIEDKSQLVQALAHAQAVYGCSQEDFATHPEVSISSRTLRTHKSEYMDIYDTAFEKYTETPQVQNVDADIDEDALEAVYQNLMSRLKSQKTSTKDIALILEYFGVSKNEFKQFADFRNATLRAFLFDNLPRIIKDETDQLLIKALIAESEFLYLGNEKTKGNTHKAMEMDVNDPLVRLELETMGLLFISLMNGHVTPAFENHAKAFRLLNWASGDKTPYEVRNAKSNHIGFDSIDGNIPPSKPFTLQNCIDITNTREEAEELYKSFKETEEKAKNRKVIKLPDYEMVAKDYENSLKAFPEGVERDFVSFMESLSVSKYDLRDKYDKHLFEINKGHGKQN